MLKDILNEIIESLNRNGYEMTFSVEDKLIDIFIKAGPSACPECLVPQNVLKKIIAEKLLENGVFYERLNIHMP